MIIFYPIFQLILIYLIQYFGDQEHLSEYLWIEVRINACYKRNFNLKASNGYGAGFVMKKNIKGHNAFTIN